MDAKEYIHKQINAVRNMAAAATKDMTTEQFNWAPPVDTLNPIKGTYVHMVTAEDHFIQAVIQGKPSLWESEGWAGTLGFAAGSGRPGWDEIRSKTLTLEIWQPYEQAVRAATDAYLASLTPEELDRNVSLFGGQRPVADALATLVIHSMGHIGDISSVRGMQGVKGLPF